MMKLDPALIRMAKRKFWKRLRKQARQAAMKEATNRGGLTFFII